LSICEGKIKNKFKKQKLMLDSSAILMYNKAIKIKIKSRGVIK